MKYLKIAFFILASFCFQIIYGQNLKIKIYNKTGFDLDSVTIGDKYVGFIKKNSFVLISDCKELLIQAGTPLHSDGIIKGKTKNTELWRIEACGIKNVKQGHFKFDIKVKENEFGYRLIWYKHK